MIRTLVVEDSPTARQLLVEILSADDEVEVVGAARNGAEAVDMARRLAPNVISMDIQMPVMDGFEATRRIMAETPTPIVLVTASADIREVELSMNALRLGALTVLPKPEGPVHPNFEEQSQRLLQTVKSMSQVRVVRRRLGRTTARLRSTFPPRCARIDALAIAASTGGPAALARILSELPGDFPVPVLVVQHIASGFAPGFAAWLNSISALRVKLAEDGERLAAKTVYIAPDERHLALASRARVATPDCAPVGGFRPSATLLFDSVGRTFGSSAIALVLTGMGQDGAAALPQLRRAGALVLAQDEASSVVFGMPGAALATGHVHETLGLDAIPARLVDLVSRQQGVVT